MKNKTLILVGISAVLAGAVAFFVYDLYKKPKSTIDSEVLDTEIEEDVVASEEKPELPNTSFPLGLLSKGKQVVALQKFLNESSSNNNLVEDGIFGPLTMKAWLMEQFGKTTPDTNTNDWKNFKAMHPDALIGKVTKSYYDSFVKKYE